MLARLFLLAANLVPVIGVAFWGWDAFELLILYWFETAIIAFWMMLRIAFSPTRPEAFLKSLVRTALLFTCHVAIFMAVNFVVLWQLFGGAWRDRISGPVSFIEQFVIGSGLWVPLVCLYAVHGLLIMAAPPAMSLSPASSALRFLYPRMVTLQLTLIATSCLMMFAGERLGPLILIGVKTAIDLYYETFGKRRAGSAGAASLPLEETTLD